MSTVEKPASVPDFWAACDPADDPFRYGWRGVPRALPGADGEVAYDMVPLTLDDLLFPEETDHQMHTPQHGADVRHLFLCFEALLADVPRSRVVEDCRVDFNVPDVKPLGPDVAVFLGVREDWGAATLRVGDLGARPLVVVEVSSPETRSNDFDLKPDYYYRANVACYVIVDSRYRGEERYDVRLIGFRHTPEGYEPIPLDDRGRLRVEPLNCWLEVEGTQVACVDGRTGRRIEGFQGQIRARQAAEERAATAEQRAAAEAEARGRADARAAASEAARLDAEAQMAAMRAEIRRLRGKG